MNPTLDIIITHYNEPDEVVRPQLDSIALQQCVDFSKIHIIIAHDGEENVPTALADEYARKGMNIRALGFPHGGVSAVRNNGMKYALEEGAEYIMFCDCDDMFLSNLGLYIIFKEIEEGSFDVLIPTFIEEGRDSRGNLFLVPHSNDRCFVHGKVYNSKYLADNGFQFNTLVHMHEDGCFNAVVTNMTSDVRLVDKAYYLWKWRDGSTVRYPLFILKTYGELCKARMFIIDELLNRGNKMQACAYATMLLFDAYYTYNVYPRGEAEDEESHLKCAMMCFALFYNKYKYLIDLMTPSSLSQISSAARKQAVAEGLTMERITFKDWIALIKTMIA